MLGAGLGIRGSGLGGGGTQRQLVSIKSGLVDCSGQLQVPNPKFQAPNPNALPTSNFQISPRLRSWDLGVRWSSGFGARDLELGIDTPETTDTVHELVLVVPGPAPSPEPRAPI